MHRFPREFADLLTRRGRRMLDGRDPATAGALRHAYFVALAGTTDARAATAARGLLEAHLSPHLETLARGIPPESITGQTRNHQERLIKTVRVRTAYLERKDSRAWRAAERIGLIAMTGSDTWHRFA